MQTMSVMIVMTITRQRPRLVFGTSGMEPNLGCHQILTSSHSFNA